MNNLFFSRFKYNMLNHETLMVKFGGTNENINHSASFYNLWKNAWGMAQWVKALTSKTDGLNNVQRIHIIGKEN